MSDGERMRAWAEAMIAELNPDALFFEGPGDSDRAIVGIATKGPGLASVVYDEDTLLETIAEGMDGDRDPEVDRLTEAREWLEYNTKGAWMGESTPWVMVRMPLHELTEPERPWREPDQAHFG